MTFRIGDFVRYTRGWRGWHYATVLGYNAARCKYMIELLNGIRLYVSEDDLEDE